MSSRYQSNGTVIELKFHTGEVEPRAYCLEATQAAILLNRSADLNEAHKYTASARTMYQAEQLPGFSWIE
jgi:hypothetical protein